MEANKKVFIRGVQGRGREVIQKLVDLGGKNGRFYSGDVDDASYYINEANIIDSCYNGSSRLNGYEEIFLEDNVQVTNIDTKDINKDNLYIPSDKLKSIVIPEEHPFCKITREMFEIYLKKNKDYGDSFSKGFDEYGMIMPCIKLGDKLLRLKQLSKNGKAEVKDESIEDTLIDLANYSVMTLIELRKRK